VRFIVNDAIGQIDHRHCWAKCMEPPSPPPASS
jgi:hypothetical protein